MEIRFINGDVWSFIEKSPAECKAFDTLGFYATSEGGNTFIVFFAHIKMIKL